MTDNRNLGLSSTEAAERLKTFGPNELLEPPRKSLLVRFLEQYKNVFFIILLVAAAASVFLGDIMESLIILFILLVNGIVGIYQEGKASKAVELLKKQLTRSSNVIRDGAEITVENGQIVPGDIVVIREGEILPADGVLIDSNMFLVNEAVLTGESLPVHKKPGDLAFGGTPVIKGSGKMEVSATGMKTRFGAIAALAGEDIRINSPLQDELGSVARHIGAGVVAISFVVFLINTAVFRVSMIESVIFAVAIAVGAIPEGLPTIIAMSLAYGASRLSRVKVIVKKLFKIETLGCVNLILTDKTGTLTSGQMCVQELFTLSDATVRVTGEAGFTDGSIRRKDGPAVSEALDRLISCAVSCNESRITLDPLSSAAAVTGDSTEGSLLFLPYKYSRKLAPVSGEAVQPFPFDSHRQMMSVAYMNNGKWDVYCKGAPEVILRKTAAFGMGESSCSKEEALARINETLEGMQKRGLRVLAMAYRQMPDLRMDGNVEDVERDLVFLGLSAILDPEREDVKEAVFKARRAGIRISMVTGDSPVIAEEIGRRTGIITAPGFRILTGTELEKMDVADIEDVASKHQELLFARTSPEQKAKIVRSFQELGYITAVTGDGVNDAPALNMADVGIAMGISGTEVAKSTASIILADDSFSTIINGIEEGRKIYGNFSRTCYFVLSTNAGELIAIVAGIMLRCNPLFTAVLILVINVATETLPAFGLGVHNSEDSVMLLPPRRTAERMMNRHFILKVLFTGWWMAVSLFVLYFWTHASAADTGGAAFKSRILLLSFSALVVEKILLSYSMCSEKPLWEKLPENRILLVSSLFSVIVIYTVVFSPLARFFAPVPGLGAADLLRVAVCALGVLIIEEGRKVLFPHRAA